MRWSHLNPTTKPNIHTKQVQFLQLSFLFNQHLMSLLYLIMWWFLAQFEANLVDAFGDLGVFMGGVVGEGDFAGVAEVELVVFCRLWVHCIFLIRRKLLLMNSLVSLHLQRLSLFKLRLTASRLHLQRYHNSHSLSLLTWILGVFMVGILSVKALYRWLGG